MEQPSILSLIIILGLSYIVIPLVLLYRSGYLIKFNTQLRLPWLFPSSSPKPANWEITNVRRLSRIEKTQIKRIKVHFDYSSCSNGIAHWVIIDVKGGKEFRFPLAEDIYEDQYVIKKQKYINNGTILDKEKLLVRTWEKAGCNNNYDLLPLE